MRAGWHSEAIAHADSWCHMTAPEKSNVRESLLNALEHRFVPILVERGFVRHPLSAEDRKSQELQIAFPVGYLKRVKGANVELLEIQLDKHGKAKFVLNFGVAKPEGVSLPWAHLRQGEAVVSALPEAFRLYRRATWRQWFSPGWLPAEVHARTARVVNEAIALYPEVETWFATGAIGKHMRSIGLASAHPEKNRP